MIRSNAARRPLLRETAFFGCKLRGFIRRRGVEWSQQRFAGCNLKASAPANAKKHRPRLRNVNTLPPSAH
jgi:hypothetical protein